jgi:hypothetical protein
LFLLHGLLESGHRIGTGDEAFDPAELDAIIAEGLAPVSH